MNCYNLVITTHNSGQTLKTYENAHSSGQRSQLTKTLTALNNAHILRKCMLTTYQKFCSQLWKMLTTCEHAQLRTCSQLIEMLTTLKNAHNLRTCSQLIEMLTTLKNAHNLRTCSQLIEMLTTLKNAHNLRTCSKLTEMLTTLPPNAERLQHSTSANAPSLPSV